MIRAILDLYILVIIADVILSYLPQMRSNPVVQGVRKAANLTLKPTRKALNQILPEDIPFDISPIVVILIIRLLMALW